MLTSPPSTDDRPIAGWLTLPPMRYPDAYAWFVLFSSMDIMLTWVILALDGDEANPVARLVIDAWGLPGAIAFKFSLILVVILACEFVGRIRDRLAHTLAQLAVIVSALPVVWSIAQLARHILTET